MRNQKVILRVASFFGLAALLGGCVTAPPTARVAAYQPVPQQIYVYPARGQSAKQTERDRYECHGWAVKQTGFNPSAPGAYPQRVVVEPSNPPGSGTAVGAIAGAILGAAIGGPYHSGAGAIAGGIAGAAIGSAADANAQAQADAAQAQANGTYQRSAAGATNYRRAFTACMSARGYTVR